MTVSQEVIENISIQVIEILAELQENSTSADEYLKSELIKLTKPNDFYLEVNARFSRVFIPEKDEHFRSLSWERINFSKIRVVIDANTLFPKNKEVDPKIVFHFVIDPTSTPEAYRLIFSKLLDI